MKIAVSGPDGSGKTTLCRKLQEHFGNVRLIHAVKHRNHLLHTTKWAYEIWRYSKRYGTFVQKIVRYIIFYPFEFIENLKRFSIKDELVIYDRHPIDRVIMKYELLLQKRNFSFYPEYIMLLFWSKLYINCFPKVDLLFVLLPSSELCIKRADGQYRSRRQAIDKIKSYKSAIKEFKKNGLNVIPFIVDEDYSQDVMSNKIIDLIKDEICCE